MRALVFGLVLAAAGSAFAEPALEGVAASARAVRPVDIGERAPVTTLRDVDGKPAPLDAYVGSGLVALVFYRGGW